MEHELFIADVDRVARVRATLVTGNDIDVLCQNIDDLALPFVTPLAAYNDRAAAWTLGFGHYARALIDGIRSGSTDQVVTRRSAFSRKPATAARPLSSRG